MYAQGVWKLRDATVDSCILKQELFYLPRLYKHVTDLNGRRFNMILISRSLSIQVRNGSEVEFDRRMLRFEFAP